MPTDVGQHHPDMACLEGNVTVDETCGRPEIGRKPTVKTRERGGVGSDLKGCTGKSEDGSPHDGQLYGVDVGPVGQVRVEGPVAHEAPVVVVLAGGGHEFFARVGVSHANVPPVDVEVRRMTSPRLFSRDLAAPG